MATFPKLKTGAMAQYPAQKQFIFQNQILRFVDGSQQRYRDNPGALHTWLIRLDQLDEEETASLNTFFEQGQGAFGSFQFTDPWDGTVYGKCSLGGDEMTTSSRMELNGKTTLKIVENRS